MMVFLDTFALIAWTNARDAAHAEVKQYLDSHADRIVTTEWILLEFADAFSGASTKPVAIEVIGRIRSLPMFDVVSFDAQVYKAGFDLFCSRLDKDWSLTDCISFAVMAERRLTDALTADHHFVQAGYRAAFKTI